jgi:hypothetical protein
VDLVYASFLELRGTDTDCLDDEVLTRASGAIGSAA